MDEPQMNQFVTKDEHGRLRDQVSELTSSVSSLATSVKDIKDNQDKVFLKLDSIGDSLNSQGKTNWPLLVSAIGIIVTVLLAGFLQTATLSAKLEANSTKADAVIGDVSRIESRLLILDSKESIMETEVLENKHELDLWWEWRLNDLPKMLDRLSDVEGKMDHIQTDHPIQNQNQIDTAQLLSRMKNVEERIDDILSRTN